MILLYKKILISWTTRNAKNQCISQIQDIKEEVVILSITEKMENKKVAFYTLGCKVNQYETNAMIQQFIKAGYDIAEFDEVADVYIVNTCTVTNMADRKSRQILRRVKELNKNAVLIAVGCYAQVAQEELEKIPEIDLILGTNEKKNIVEFIEKLVEEKKDKGNSLQERYNKENTNILQANNNSKNIQNNIKDTSKLSEGKIHTTDVLHCEEYADFGDVTFTEKTRAVIKVQDGCDRFCSYCIIPFARGHIRSRNPESVISEITKIAQSGIKEVVITGIHLTSYGRDFKKEFIQDLTDRGYIKSENLGLKENKNNINQYRLIDLLEAINKIDGIERIRLRFIRTNFNN